MKKIYIHFNSLDGCSLHRLILPYELIEKQTTEDFQFTFGYDMNLPTNQLAYIIAQHDLMVFHRILDDGLLQQVRSLNPNIKVVIDMDDSWRLNEQHMLYQMYRLNDMSNKILQHVKNADYVTCTTQYLANQLKPFNPNIYVFENALSPHAQFVSKPTQSDRLRFGLIGGSTHMNDVQLLNGVARSLSPDILNKIQFVLCGFDSSYKVTFDADGTPHYTQSPWQNNAWVKLERMLTNNYTLTTPEHTLFLQQYNRIEYDSKDCYRRIWLKSIYEYATAYNSFDVLLVPLLDNSFNACKSELKLIEASVMNKAAIVSDVMPYKICGINAIEKGGAINPLGNCIMVNNQKKCAGWVKAITRLTTDTNLRQLITNNLHQLTEHNAQYNLQTVANKRIKFLYDILQS